jgi:feruloyl esterase
MTTRLTAALVVMGPLALGAHLLAQGEGRAASGAACTVIALQHKAPRGTTVTAATIVEAKDSQPRHCQVDGRVAVPGNEVNFRIGLPENWNGKFYFGGVGGLAGRLGSIAPGLERGYASATTDTGHDANDPTWGANRAKEVDYGHRGTHVTAVAGKELTAAFYGQAPRHAYFNGCSNGGRQAFMEVQRYPADFDGVIAGHPAIGTPQQAGRAIVFQKLLASAESLLTAEKVEMLAAATLSACDLSDGLEDGLVGDPRRCTFTPESLRCKGADAPTCLTAPQIEVVKQVYDGAKLASGEIYAYGFPAGHEGGTTGWRQWITGNTPPTRQSDGTYLFTSNLPTGFNLSEQNFRFLSTDDDDPSFTWRSFRLDRDLPRLKVMTDILSPLDPDLRPFKARGGKLLIYHGWADPAISAYGSIDYYEKVGKVVGGPRELESFARLYLAPGMHHCAGGPGPNEFDALSVLEQWVERGTAPAAIVATHRRDGTVTRTRPLCPYPQVARYTGAGSIDDAASFRCEAPPAR